MEDSLFTRWTGYALAIAVPLTSVACGGSDATGPGSGGGVPTRLAFLTPPADAGLTAPLTPAVRVAIQDSAGNTVTSATGTIEISIEANPSGATLSGTTTRDAVNGVATFDDLVIDRSGFGYTLTASAAGLASATSAGFEVAFLLDWIAPGGPHTCGVARGGDAYCWGANYNGQLGNGEGAPQLLETVPQRVLGDLAFVELGTGEDHSCGLTPGGAAYCWGNNGGGNLGDGGQEQESHAPVAVAGGLTFRALAINQDHGCALTDNGAAYCWGFNPYGQLGNSSAGSKSDIPVPVQGGLAFEILDSGTYHVCGIATSGTTYCWGRNDSGQLGDGTQEDRDAPTAVSGGLEFTALTAGGRHTCGVTTQGSTYCWGEGNSGRLGTGSEADRLTPTVVVGGESFVQLAAGEGHTCGLTSAGAAYCWGRNDRGQLGDGGASGTLSTTPVPVSGGLSFAQLRVGDSHTCALTARGDPYCWGDDDWGKLGNGPPEDEPATTPVRVADPDA